MRIFRAFLAILFVGISVYTAITVSKFGPNLFPSFVGDIKSMTWAGQFNFDFSCFLLLSGLWVSWRHHFTGKGIALGLVATVGGIMFLAPYLFIVSLRAKDDIKEVLLGSARASA